MLEAIGKLVFTLRPERRGALRDPRVEIDFDAPFGCRDHEVPLRGLVHALPVEKPRRIQSGDEPACLVLIQADLVDIGSRPPDEHLGATGHWPVRSRTGSGQIRVDLDELDSPHVFVRTQLMRHVM